MKRLFLTLLFLILSCGLALSEDLYVTQNGTSPYNGTASYPFRVSDFNNSGNWGAGAGKISPGDYVYFSGTITSQILPQGSGTEGNYITLDGYAAGSCDPVSTGAACGSAATVTTSESDGNGNIGIYLYNVSHFIIQDFNIDTVSGGVYTEGTSGTHTTDIIVRRCFIDNAYWQAVNGTYANYLTVGGSNGNGNYIKDYATLTGYENGSQAIGAENVQDFVVSYNKVRSPVADVNHSDNIVAIHSTSRALVEYNDLSNTKGGACISVKEGNGNSDIVLRFNNLYDGPDYGDFGISVGYTHNVYIYGNYVHDQFNGIRIKEEVDGGIYIWSNIISGGHSKGLYYDQIGGSWAPKSGYFYNNTLYAMQVGYWTSIDHAAASLESIYSGETVTIKNNIFMDNKNGPNASDKYQIYVQSIANFLEGYNQYYYTGTGDTTGVVRINPSTYKTVSELTNSNYGDPGMTNPGGGDFTLDGSVIDNGTDLTAPLYVVIQGVTITMNTNLALNPSTTDWTTTPPTVNTVARGSAGLGSWDRGAYEYGTSGGSDTNNPSPDPSTWATEPAADSTSQISMIATTASDASPPVEYYFNMDSDADSCAEECGADFGTGGTDSGWQESTSYSDSGLQTNKCYCYVVLSRDQVPNTGSDSTPNLGGYTLAATPVILTLDNATDTTIDITDIDINGNPTSNPATLYAIVIGDTSPPDGDAQDQWIQADGSYGASKHWFTYAEIIAVITVTDLKTDTSYGIEAIAKNGDGIETTYSTTAYLSTTGDIVTPPEIIKGLNLTGIYIGNAP